MKHQDVLQKSLRLSVEIEKFPIAGKFIISRGSKTEAAVVSVILRDEQNHIGRAECVPYSRYKETVEGVKKTIEELSPRFFKGISRTELQSILPAGAARNALDCALWDLEAKKENVRAHAKAGFQMLKPVSTAYTISLGTPDEMFEAVKKASDRPILKVKLGGPDGDLERIRAIRRGAPSAKFIADANEGWSRLNVEAHLSACAEAGFSLIEQPMPATEDEFLRSIPHPVRLCADESVHDRASLKRLAGLYECVNIKLDKTGGLTEALLLAKDAEALGFSIMVGCMVGTSLGMAPALVLAAKAEFVDLDGPLLLARDRENGLRYEGSIVYPPEPSLWG